MWFWQEWQVNGGTGGAGTIRMDYGHNALYISPAEKEFVKGKQSGWSQGGG